MCFIYESMTLKELLTHNLHFSPFYLYFSLKKFLSCFLIFIFPISKLSQSQHFSEVVIIYLFIYFYFLYFQVSLTARKKLHIPAGLFTPVTLLAVSMASETQETTPAGQIYFFHPSKRKFYQLLIHNLAVCQCYAFVNIISNIKTCESLHVYSACQKQQSNSF